MIGKAVAIKPGNPEALVNLGNALQELKRHDQALASYDKALALKPDYAEALSNRGLTLQALKRHDEALASYGKALALEPDFAEAHANLGLLRLLLGDFERGWEEYEWRWKGPSFSASRRNFSQPLWLGEDGVSGKTLLIHAEQGLGDTIQFVRYARQAAEKGATVVLQVQPALKALLASAFGRYQVLAEGEPLPRFDLHCPFLSLPLAFKTRLDSIPAQVPYLAAPVAAIDKWSDRLGQKGVPRIGIVWSGRSTHANDANRSIALTRLMPLRSPDVQLVSLQNEVRAEDARVLTANAQILHFGPELKDFSDTAALVSLVDLVVSVDTSVAHLAGALGKPVWILVPFAPDWRWLLEREDSPWYPSARIFRQPKLGDWDSVIDKVRQALTERLASDPPSIPGTRA
ncbi:MAG: tetratricopeptide repeat protein [Burkholderiales bacterium]